MYKYLSGQMTGQYVLLMYLTLNVYWYVVAPDNTFGEGFNWETAPWFDANGLQDVAKIEKESVVEKLQNN